MSLSLDAPTVGARPEPLGNGSASRSVRALRASARLALCLGLVVALPVGNLTSASASPLPSTQHSEHAAPPGWGGTRLIGGTPGWGIGGTPGWGRSVGHRGRLVLTGTVVVVQVNANTFSLSPTASTIMFPSASTVAVNVLSSTVYREPTVKSPSLADVQAGDEVVVTGAWDGTSAISAASVFIPLAACTGTVTATSSGSFTLKTARGLELTVDVTSSTTYREPGKSSNAVTPAIGDQVRVLGTQAGAGVVNAVSVLVNPYAHHGRPNGHGARSAARRP